MTRLFVPALFIAGGILSSGIVIFSLHEPTSINSALSHTEHSRNQQPNSLDFSQYVDLWNGRDHANPLPAVPRTVESLWAEAIRSAHTAGSPTPAILRKLVQTDTEALHKLLQNYEREQDPNLRGLFKSILFGVHKPEVIKFAVKLTESSSPLAKVEGFELLGQLPLGDRELQQAAMKAISKEDDPVIVRAAVSALNPKLSPPMETAQIAAKLHQLAQHADPAVRRESIVLLSRWDGSANMESRFEQAFNDPAYAVRLAAIWALRDSNIRSDNIKHGLLNILRGDEEYTKQAALYMLKTFNLNQEESELYKQVYAELNPK